jgi:large subunit ribosomal protein L2
MGVRKFKPTTPGQRHKIADDFSDLTTGNNPEKSPGNSYSGYQ